MRLSETPPSRLHTLAAARHLSKLGPSAMQSAAAAMQQTHQLNQTKWPRKKTARCPVGGGGPRALSLHLRQPAARGPELAGPWQGRRSSLLWARISLSSLRVREEKLALLEPLRSEDTPTELQLMRLTVSSTF